MWAHVFITPFRCPALGGVSFELLSEICQMVYGSGSIGDINPAVCRIYMMMLGHSNFLSLMLDTNVETHPTKSK